MRLFGRRRGAVPRGPGVEPEDDASRSPQLAQPDETVEGERTIASVHRVRSVQSRVSNVLAIGLMSAIGLGLLTWYYSGAITRQARAQQTAEMASRARAQGEMPLPPLGRIEPPAPPPAKDSLTERVLGPPPEPPDPAALAAWNQADALMRAQPAYAGPPQKTPAELALERRLAGVVFARQSSGAAPASTALPTASMSADPGAAALESYSEAAASSRAAGGDTLAGLLEPSVTPAVSARVLPTQRFLLPKGAFIDCTLETAIDSTLPGMTTCITATDTFSVDGKVVLLERGTKLVGETRGQVQQGAARLFVLWTEARTPTGVVVPLASPGTDELGRAGLPGEVNRHFWERFGAAILLSVIDGAVQAAVQSASENQGTVIVNPSATQDVMTEVLKSTVAIPPTIRKAQGDRIQVLVARDLDFRSVYELRVAAALRDGNTP